MKKCTTILAVLVSLIGISTYAVFTNLTILWHKGTGQRVLLCGDGHVDTTDMKDTLANRTGVISVVQDLYDRGESVHCLVEDGYSFNLKDFDSYSAADKKKCCEDKLLVHCAQMMGLRFGQNLLQCSPLSFLEKCLLEKGLSGSNIERRSYIDRHSRVNDAFGARIHMYKNIKSCSIRRSLLDFMKSNYAMPSLYASPNSPDDRYDYFIRPLLKP
ncbi:MAG TPA: hypothetical protein VGT41_03585 [Candidatus Babeliales bacterium]|nr:hypothetical protein [Candidatus Babeliales bacterium]